jgi:hypothetical protein
LDDFDGVDVTTYTETGQTVRKALVTALDTR